MEALGCVTFAHSSTPLVSNEQNRSDTSRFCSLFLWQERRRRMCECHTLTTKTSPEPVEIRRSQVKKWIADAVADLWYHRTLIPAHGLIFSGWRPRRLTKIDLKWEHADNYVSTWTVKLSAVSMHITEATGHVFDQCDEVESLHAHCTSSNTELLLALTTSVASVQYQSQWGRLPWLSNDIAQLHAN